MRARSPDESPPGGQVTRRDGGEQVLAPIGEAGLPRCSSPGGIPGGRVRYPKDTTATPHP